MKISREWVFQTAKFPKGSIKLNWDNFSRGAKEGDSNQTQWKNIFWNKIMNKPLYELFLLLKFKKDVKS